MAVKFEEEGDIIRIVQTRTGLRITAWIIAVCLPLSLTVMIFLSLHQSPSSLECDHAAGQCTLTVGTRVTHLPIASIVRASFKTDDGAYVEIQRDESPHFQDICGATDAGGAAAARDFADQLEAFRSDASHAPIALHCLGRPVHGVKLAIVGPASVFGWLIVFLLVVPLAVETRAVLDRRSNTIDVTGRGWLRSAWEVHRPLTDVAHIELRAGAIWRGQRQYFIYAAFKDDTVALLWTPAAIMISTLEARVATLRRFIGQSDA